MTAQERRMIEQWKADLARDRQLQPLLPPDRVRKVGDAFRRLRRLTRPERRAAV